MQRTKRISCLAVLFALIFAAPSFATPPIQVDRIKGIVSAIDENTITVSHTSDRKPTLNGGIIINTRMPDGNYYYGVWRITHVSDNEVSGEAHLIRRAPEIGMEVYIESERAGQEPTIYEHHDPLLGMLLEYLDWTSKKKLGIERGLRITAVRPGYPAEQAGIFAGDVLVSVGGTKIMGSLPYDIDVYSRLLKPGSTVEIEIIRNGEKLTVHSDIAQANR